MIIQNYHNHKPNQQSPTKQSIHQSQHLVKQPIIINTQKSTHNKNMITDKLLTLLIVFAVGGAICALAQILIVKTKLTPARILIVFLVIGIILQTVGVYEPIAEFAKTGISVPIVGFGAALAKGAMEFTTQYGIIGAFAGGLTNSAFGIGECIVASYLITLIFSSKSKK